MRRRYTRGTPRPWLLEVSGTHGWAWERRYASARRAEEVAAQARLTGYTAVVRYQPVRTR